MLDFLTSVTSRLKQGPLAAPWATQIAPPRPHTQLSHGHRLGLRREASMGAGPAQLPA